MKPRDLLDLKGVVGVSEDDDIWNDKDTITVFVKKKLKMTTLQRYIRDKRTDWSEKDVIPKEIKGKKTDVIEIGEVRAQLDRKKYRPVKGGCEIGIKGERFVGTAGAIVKAYSYRGLWLIDGWYSFLRLIKLHNLIPKTEYLILTNAHVAEKDVRKHERKRIVQPGLTYNGIGYNIYSIPIKPGKYNEYDCSLVLLDEAFELENIEVGKITGVKDAVIGEEVHKYGRTTDYTTGNLAAKNVSVSIDYGEDIGKVRFVGLDLYTRMSNKGDSGSVIVSLEDNKAVAHLFAGSNTATFGIPMTKVASRLGIEFV